MKSVLIKLKKSKTIVGMAIKVFIKLVVASRFKHFKKIQITVSSIYPVVLKLVLYVHIYVARTHYEYSLFIFSCLLFCYTYNTNALNDFADKTSRSLLTLFTCTCRGQPYSTRNPKAVAVGTNSVCVSFRSFQTSERTLMTTIGKRASTSRASPRYLVGRFPNS